MRRNVKDWIKAINEAPTDEEMVRLYTEMTGQCPRTPTGAWDRARDKVTMEVHQAVGLKVATAFQRLESARQLQNDTQED
tara:strand:+ start:113 stop:352 length:240 start_codon:yes stop_codon:yes gene_type:complete